MEKLVLIVHVLTALSIIGLILLQQGKGAEAGASFGAGASGTVFGSQGSGNFFSRLTAIMATVFFVTSLGLAILAKQGSEGDIDANLPQLQESTEQPAPADDSDIPQLDVAPESSDIPEVGDAPEAPAADEPQSEEVPTAEEGGEQQ